MILENFCPIFFGCNFNSFRVRADFFGMPRENVRIDLLIKKYDRFLRVNLIESQVKKSCISRLRIRAIRTGTCFIMLT